MNELGAMGSAAEPIELATNPVTVQVVLHSDAPRQIDAYMIPSTKTRLMLTIGSIEYRKAAYVHYDVYVGMPNDAKPDYKNPYYVGTIVLPRPRGAGRGSNAQFDITRAVRAVKSLKSWNDAHVSVTFVLHGPSSREVRPLSGVGPRLRDIKILAVAPESQSTPH